MIKYAAKNYFQFYFKWSKQQTDAKLPILKLIFYERKIKFQYRESK